MDGQEGGTPPRQGHSRVALEAWDEAEPHVLRFLLKIALNASMWAAAPFLAVALGLALFGKPALWVLVSAGVGAALVLLGLCAYLVLRHKLRRLRAKVAAASAIEATLFSMTDR